MSEVFEVPSKEVCAAAKEQCRKLICSLYEEGVPEDEVLLVTVGWLLGTVTTRMLEESGHGYALHSYNRVLDVARRFVECMLPTIKVKSVH